MIIKDMKKNSVKFIFDQESELPVFLAGDFNDWNPLEDPMELKNGKGEFQQK